jgi:hypothetical protein
MMIDHLSGIITQRNDGDLIEVIPPPNSHGCRDSAVLRWNKWGTGTVVEVQSCNSCWQVGHDANHIFAEVGQEWPVDMAKLKPTGATSRNSVKWLLEV